MLAAVAGLDASVLADATSAPPDAVRVAAIDAGPTPVACLAFRLSRF